MYCFGDPAKMSDPNVKLALRVHDECNGSDVFGSDICTCRPYLIFGLEEAVKEAQQGGSGVVIYFRKEGRALGEVTKYLVYNARKPFSGRCEFDRRSNDVWLQGRGEWTVSTLSEARKSPISLILA